LRCRPLLPPLRIELRAEDYETFVLPLN